MYQKQKPILNDLHQRLYSILPESKPISTWEGGREGTYKAVDADGNVFLVDFSYFQGVLRHEKRFFCDYAGLLSSSTLKTEPKRASAGENWTVTLLGSLI
jgi:hypothetical protein